MTDYKEKYNNLLNKIIVLNAQYKSNMQQIVDDEKAYRDNNEYLINQSKLEGLHELIGDDMDCLEITTGYWSKSNDKIQLKDSSAGDSRTSKKNPSLKEIRKAVNIHIEDVDKGLEYWKYLITERQGNHDWTKLDNFDNEYGFLVHNGVKDEVFLKTEWWHKHITEERHHLQYYTPNDVNLIDVLELITDRVVAEKGRTGKIIKEYLEIDTNILKDAYWNTVRLLDDKTERIE